MLHPIGATSEQFHSQRQLRGFDGVGEDGGFKSGYCIQKQKRKLINKQTDTSAMQIATEKNEILMLQKGRQGLQLLVLWMHITS